ncbi:MAG: pilus assembly FimT family protein [Desulfitobacteriaceae bacterium]
MGDTSGRFAKLKENSLGFTLIEIMIVIAVVGILAMVTVPKYQGLTDHYHLESSAQIVAGQLRIAKQYAMDRRDDIYVMFNPTSVQIFYLDKASYEFISLDTQQNYDSGITFNNLISHENGESLGVKDLSIVINDLGHEISNIPPYDQCLIFNRKGFLSNPVNLVLKCDRTGQKVSINQTLVSLEIMITWLTI